ncbi:hypothetical protein KHU50_006095 [Colletotrichum sp. SAR 10_65]|nr:hypothetical protein KHU50_006095 [Colletotrichum sp. SAR 10_65]KAI8173411.1 hypothetical protein K4K51_009888 [Colletotrichum sp. SAR 10_75]KAJ5002640.1 hypothetical protein K4K48_013122 [Colletotrichum sp. SAR 10_66]
MFTGNEPGNEKLTANEMIQDCNLEAQTKIQALTDKITSYTDILKIFNWEMLADLSDTANVIVTKTMELRVAQASAILPMEIRSDATVKFLGRLAMEKLGGDITVGIDSYMQRTKAKYDRLRADQEAQMADNRVLGHSSATISTAESTVMTSWDSFNDAQVRTDSDGSYDNLDPQLIDWQFTQTTEHHYL